MKVARWFLRGYRPMKWVSLGIVLGIGLNPYLLLIEERKRTMSKNKMECPTSMANHMQKPWTYTVSSVNSVNRQR